MLTFTLSNLLSFRFQILCPGRMQVRIADLHRAPKRAKFRDQPSGFDRCC